jgi:hypothetical protein
VASTIAWGVSQLPVEARELGLDGLLCLLLQQLLQQLGAPLLIEAGGLAVFKPQQQHKRIELYGRVQLSGLQVSQG